MPQRSPVATRPGPTSSADFDEQRWPIVCAIAILVGIVSGIVVAKSDFDDNRLLFNGYSYLAAVVVAAGLLISVAYWLKDGTRRKAELCIVLSLAVHCACGIAGYFLFSMPIDDTAMQTDAAAGSAAADQDLIAPDYHWTQAEEPDAVQSYEAPVATPVREQPRQAAAMESRNMDRPTPVNEIPRAVKAELTPLGAAAATAPGEPLDIHRAKAADAKEAKPAEALAMARRQGNEMALPKGDAVVSLPELQPAKEPAKNLEPTAIKNDKVDWASLTPKTPDAKAAVPRRVARSQSDTGEGLPPLGAMAQLPTQAPPKTTAPQAGPDAADKISRQAESPERSNRGLSLPSTVLADAGAPSQLPPAAGSSLPSRLAANSSVAVEGSEDSHAPLGPTNAAMGTQAQGRGRGALPARIGSAYGEGHAQPSIAGATNEDSASLRLGSSNSDLVYGVASPFAAARRATASETARGGSQSAPNLSNTLARTRATNGIDLPVATAPSETVAMAGAGGTADRPGGATSKLEVGQNIRVQRTAGPASPRGSPLAIASTDASTDAGDDRVRFGSETGKLNGSINGTGLPGGARRIEPAPSGNGETGDGEVPRSRAMAVNPDASAVPLGQIALSPLVPIGAQRGAAAQVVDAAPLGPSSRHDLGAFRLEGSGQRLGMHTSSQTDLADLGPLASLASLQPSGAAGRGNRGEGQLDDILSASSSGAGQAIRRTPGLDVSGLVHEPMEPFRRGSSAPGAGIGDSTSGQLTEPAIESGLEFFSHTQFADGHWSLDKVPDGASTADLGTMHADSAATGMALLTYLGAGYTQQDEKYRDVVRRGVQWLIQHQKADGNLSFGGDAPTQFYSHGIASMALCEAYGMTQDPTLREPAQKAIRFIVAAQDPRRGGWRYQPQDGSDTSVTGWQLLALKSGQMAGLDVPEETLRRVGGWLDKARGPDDGTYVYNPWALDTELERQGRAPSPTMTAQAMVMRMYLGQSHDNDSLKRGAEFIKAHPPEVGTASSPQRNCYYWYYATQAMYHMRGEYWKTWDAQITPLLRAGQVSSGSLKGSWNPKDPVPDRWGEQAGRHFVTCMHLMTLEFRYWHLPLFRELRKEE